MDLEAIDRREAMILSRFAPAEEPSGTYRRGRLPTARRIVVRVAARLFRRALLALARLLARIHVASQALGARIHAARGLTDFDPHPRFVPSRIATR
jgi:hypothetical protein